MKSIVLLAAASMAVCQAAVQSTPTPTPTPHMTKLSRRKLIPLAYRTDNNADKVITDGPADDPYIWTEPPADYTPGPTSVQDHLCIYLSEAADSIRWACATASGTPEVEDMPTQQVAARDKHFDDPNHLPDWLQPGQGQSDAAAAAADLEFRATIASGTDMPVAIMQAYYITVEVDPTFFPPPIKLDADPCYFADFNQFGGMGFYKRSEIPRLRRRTLTLKKRDDDDTAMPDAPAGAPECSTDAPLQFNGADWNTQGFDNNCYQVTIATIMGLTTEELENAMPGLQTYWNTPGGTTIRNIMNLVPQVAAVFGSFRQGFEDLRQRMWNRQSFEETVIQAATDPDSGELQRRTFGVGFTRPDGSGHVMNMEFEPDLFHRDTDGHIDDFGVRYIDFQRDNIGADGTGDVWAPGSLLNFVFWIK